jgi:putative transcriptional regulator
MMRNWLQRPILLIALLALLPASAGSKPEMTPGDISLAGQLLIASADNGDPRFDHAVILMVRHNKNGALGIIINQPMEERPLASLLAEMGEDTAGIEGSVPLFAGGPVEPEAGFVLHSPDYHLPQTLDVDGGVALTSARQIISDIAHRRGPRKTLIAFGYSGWGPGQLESELILHAWLTAPADAQLIFDEDREKVWNAAMARRTRPL